MRAAAVYMHGCHRHKKYKKKRTKQIPGARSQTSVRSVHRILLVFSCWLYALLLVCFTILCVCIVNSSWFYDCLFCVYIRCCLIIANNFCCCCYSVQLTFLVYHKQIFKNKYSIYL